jgi:hypothetical protein
VDPREEAQESPLLLEVWRATLSLEELHYVDFSDIRQVSRSLARSSIYLSL